MRFTEHPESFTYTAPEAARILRLSSQRVRQLLASGELRGVRDEVGHWEVDSRSVHALLDERREVLFGALEDPQRLSELEAEVRELRYFLGRAEARLEMPAQLESVLREALERERERADRLEAELASLREARKPSPEPRDASEARPVDSEHRTGLGIRLTEALRALRSPYSAAREEAGGGASLDSSKSKEGSCTTYIYASSMGRLCTLGHASSTST